MGAPIFGGTPEQVLDTWGGEGFDGPTKNGYLSTRANVMAGLRGTRRQPLLCSGAVAQLAYKKVVTANDRESLCFSVPNPNSLTRLIDAPWSAIEPA